jgi:hypothetical protein
VPETHKLARNPCRILQRIVHNPKIAVTLQTLLDLGLAVKVLHHLFEDRHRIKLLVRLQIVWHYSLKPSRRPQQRRLFRLKAATIL